MCSSDLYQGNESFKIKKSKIRGEISEGMICAEDELNLGTSHDGIMVLDKEVPTGTLARDYFKIEEDTIYEIGLTPNRIDGASHFGVARDIAAYLNQFADQSASLPSVNDFSVENEGLVIPVEVVKREACIRYSGITLTGVQVGPSPEWLQNRLRSIGLNPINNVVDITNFVLQETGQPLHTFDAEKISGGRVVVKTLKEGTPFVTLDGEERKMSADDLMICNEKEGMCIAGVFGGIDSGVTEDTRSVFLESACFDPVFIRKTARRHGLNTDASFRFERGTDPEMTLYALKRAALLIKEIAGGRVSSPIQDVYPEPAKPAVAKLQFAHLSRLTGLDIPLERIHRILRALDFKILEETEQFLLLEVPLYRVDVRREADIIEEILRIFGYNQVGTGHQIRSSMNRFEKPDKEKVTHQFSDLLSANGFHEIMSNSLTAKVYYEQEEAFNANASVELFNPLSQDLNVLRQSMIFGGLEAVIYNINRKRSDLKLFELGTCYHLDPKAEKILKQTDFIEDQRLALFVTGRKKNESWNSDNKNTDFYYMKGIVQLILQKAGIDPAKLDNSGEAGPLFSEGLVYTLNNKELVRFGQVSDNTLESFEIEQNVFFGEFRYEVLLSAIAGNTIQFNPVPKFPEVRRDLALLLDRSVNFEQIHHLAFQTEKKLLKKVQIFDVYTGEKIEKDKKSYAVSFKLQDTEIGRAHV